MVTMLFDAQRYHLIMQEEDLRYTEKELEWILCDIIFETLAVGVIPQNAEHESPDPLPTRIKTEVEAWVWAKLHPISYFDLRCELTIELVGDVISIKGVM